MAKDWTKKELEGWAEFFSFCTVMLAMGLAVQICISVYYVHQFHTCRGYLWGIMELYERERQKVSQHGDQGIVQPVRGSCVGSDYRQRPLEEGDTSYHSSSNLD
jgi:hypothetical protein